MKKRICFFSVGFAFNRLVRLKFYEKIFPKDINIFLFTTNKYQGKEKQSYQKEWTGLKRTKIVYAEYDPIKTFFNLRKFCKKNKIERVINLGFHTAWPILFFSTVFSKRDYCLNVLTDIFKQHYLVETKKEKLNEIFTLVFLWLGVFFAEKVFFTDRLNAQRAPIFFVSGKEKMSWLAAPVDTSRFKMGNKETARKKIGMPLNTNVVIFVGRISYLKCSDILRKLINENKDIYFIVVGRLIDKEFLDIKSDNFEYIEMLSSEQLVDYYNASDLSFCLNRGGGGLGLTSEEALACGVPIIVSKEFKLKKSASLFQVSVDFKEVNNVVRYFFKLPEKERLKLSKYARKYAEDDYSDDVWREKYINAYLK